MANKNTITMRVDPEFKKLINDIKLEEMKKGKILSDRRITSALTKIPTLKGFILKRGIKDDKK